MQRSLPMDQSASTTDLSGLPSKQMTLSSSKTPSSPMSSTTSVNTTTPSSSSSSSSKSATMSTFTLYNLLESEYDYDDEVLFAPAAVKQGNIIIIIIIITNTNNNTNFISFRNDREKQSPYISTIR